MNGISVDVIVLLLRGIPEGLLSTWAIHVFTRTKIDQKKYLFLSFIFIASTYIVRLLPITLGVNTILSLFVLIVSFQFVYSYQLSRIVSTVISAIVVIVLIAVAEVLNIYILTFIYGLDQAEILFNSTGLTRSICTTPTTVFFAIFILLGKLILKKFDKRKKAHGDTGKEIRA